MGPNGNIGVVANPLYGVINLAEALVEEVIEAFMDVICLDHNHRVAFNGRVTNGSNCVDLKEGKGREERMAVRTHKLLAWDNLSDLPTSYLL